MAPAQESLYLTLGGRALDSRMPRPFLGDRLADEVLKASGRDLSEFRTLGDTAKIDPSKVFDIAVRAKRMDDAVRAFAARHPDAVVLDLGAGLDTRMARVAPPATVDWYDVDVPEVIALRRELIPSAAAGHVIAADVTDPGWLDDVPGDRPAVMVGDGLIGFLTQDAMIALFDRLTRHFTRGGELAFNQYTTFSVWALKHLSGFAAIAGGAVNPGFNDPRQPERWVPALHLAEELLLTRAPEVALFPASGRAVVRMIAWSRTMSRLFGTVVLRYRFPGAKAGA
jgi:O-methyltransferase involved in polyketide biosynthesis